MNDAILGKEPPKCVKINRKERPFWDYIIAARADWTEVDLVHAAALAGIMAEMQEQKKLMAKEGAVIIGANKAAMVNPRMKVLEALTRMSLGYSAKIQVHANATIGSADEQLNKNKQKQAAIAAAKDNGQDMDEGLIARPN